MAVPVIQTAFSAGELSPSMYGRIDLDKWHTGAATMRNFFASYRGGAVSRGGTKFVGQSKQPTTSAPPRLIPFKFSVTQNYVLEFGDAYMRIISDGGYVTEPAVTITGASQANPCHITASNSFSSGDWVFIQGIVGMDDLNNQIFIVENASGSGFDLYDTRGASVDSTSWAAYVSGGTAARIYTVATPYAAVDLPYLKFTQSADVMTLTLVNQETLVEYPPYNLTRAGATNWTLTAVSFASSIVGPSGATAFASNTTTSNATQYQYCTTAVSATTGEESVASPIATVTNSVDIATVAGAITVNWGPVTGASSYNVYKAPAGVFGATVPTGSLFGFVGTALGTQFIDSNVTADMATTPPLHRNPFARSAVTAAPMTALGSGYTTASASINTSTGSGAVLLPVIIAGTINNLIVENGGSGYSPSDTVTISGNGSGATATLQLGPATGTYPGCVAYFQQRRVYASSLNNPDTYWMSKPGAFNNMDTSSTAVDDDAITGSPWSQQVNGIQAMIPMPGGLVVLTGLGAWQLAGSGGSGTNPAAITPATQQAQPQAYNGCNPTVPPITINYDILYVQTKGSIVRDLSYNFFVNIYTGTDMTVMSNHLFTNHQILQWAWAEEPHKVVWCVREDGIALSFTFLKEQNVYAWARHDTNGLFTSVCSVSEPPVDAVYFVVKRFILGSWYYYVERMDPRTWDDVETAWCVDAGLSSQQSFPNATLSFSAASGSSVSVIATASVFPASTVGQILRYKGALGTVTVASGTGAIVDFTQPVNAAPITAVLPNDPSNTPVPAQPGEWSLATPITTVKGLRHLEGKTVAALADGSVVPNQVVEGGRITLPVPASLITVGLPFQAQLESLYLEAGPPTAQGRRKKINACTVRVDSSRGLKVGAVNQDGGINLAEIKQRGNQIDAGAPIPLFTGDQRINLNPAWATVGQVMVQQDYCLPATVLAIVPELTIGDSPG